MSVTFADYSTGDITNRFWSFCDGSTGNTTAGTTNHTYAAGSNTVSLTVYASSGSNTFTRTNFIIVAGGGGVPPSITQQPLSTNVCAGSTATFSVTATGDAPLFYQWQTNSINLVNGGEFSGATSTVLTVSSASATDAATYRCIVTNAAGSDTSSNATLTVNALPTQYTVGGGGSYCSGGSGVAVTLSSSQLGVTYYLQLGGSNTGATQAGTGSGLNFTGVTAAGTYGILASNTVTGCTATMSGGATVSLTDPFQCWQLQYFGCTNCPQAAADADPLGKGMSNTNQLLAGLNPTNPASVFRITSVVADSSSNVMITWSTAGVRTNAVQAASVGVSGDYDTNFVDITTSPHIIIPATGDFTTNYLDAGGATNTPSRFYRIRLVP